MTTYTDLADLQEDDRIETIGRTASQGALVGFIVEDDAKADRYIAKLHKRYPTVSVVDRGAGPTAFTVLVRVRGVAS